MRGSRSVKQAVVLGATVAALAACSSSGDDAASAGTSASSSGSPSGAAESTSASTADSEDLDTAITDRIALLDGTFGSTDFDLPDVETLDGFANASGFDAGDLEQAGFEAGAYQHVSVPWAADGIRAVMRFDSTADAAEFVKNPPKSSVRARTFAIRGVPGGVGADFVSYGTMLGRNATFSVGQDVYVLGFAPKRPPSRQQPSRADLGRMAKQWYDGVRDLG
jgi:hypothetical protein